MEREFGKKIAIATQNIDGLHAEAGSSKVLEVHGTMATLSCRDCGCRRPHTDFVERFRAGDVPRCPECGGVMRPDIVFFGENLPEEALEESMAAFEECDLAVVLGTSLKVYPAAGLPSLRKRGVPLVIVNREPTSADYSAELVFHDSIGEVLQRSVAAWRSWNC
jgi:NAD-dependent deacetylase